MEVKQEPIKIYARVGGNNYVTQFIETAHNKNEILETDIFIEEGYGDYFAYPHARVGKPLIALNFRGCHNYKMVDETLAETTPEEKAAELALRPKPEEHITIDDMKMAVAEISIAQAEMQSQSEQAIAELSIMIGGMLNV